MRLGHDDLRVMAIVAQFHCECLSYAFALGLEPVLRGFDRPACLGPHPAVSQVVERTKPVNSPGSKWASSSCR